MTDRQGLLKKTKISTEILPFCVLQKCRFFIFQMLTQTGKKCLPSTRTITWKIYFPTSSNSPLYSNQNMLFPLLFFNFPHSHPAGTIGLLRRGKIDKTVFGRLVLGNVLRLGIILPFWLSQHLSIFFLPSRDTAVKREWQRLICPSSVCLSFFLKREKSLKAETPLKPLVPSVFRPGCYRGRIDKSQRRERERTHKRMMLIGSKGEKERDFVEREMSCRIKKEAHFCGFQTI